MSREGRLRLIGLHAVLVASMVQGLTPDACSLASPWGLEWLRAAMSSGGADAGLGRRLQNERPFSGDTDQDATSAEVAIPDEPMVRATPHPRPADWCNHASASIDRFGPWRGPDRGPWPRASRPYGPDDDPIARLCRLTC